MTEIISIKKWLNLYQVFYKNFKPSNLYMFSKIKSHFDKGSLFSVASNVIYKPFKKIGTRTAILKKDLVNKIRYGKNAPLYYERLWINPEEVTQIIYREEVKRVTGIKREKASGVVVDWNKIENISPLENEFRIQYCTQHWVEGKSWEELEIFEFMAETKVYGDWPVEKIKKRFAGLDKTFEETKALGRLKTREEIDPSGFREKDGILVHFGENGIPYFGGNGFHRLAIAKILKLKEIPVCVGIVDKHSIDKLNQYRK